jgi:hypothetical protein
MKPTTENTMQDDQLDHTVMVTLFYKISAYDYDHATDIVKEILSDLDDERLFDTEYQVGHYLGGTK